MADYFIKIYRMRFVRIASIILIYSLTLFGTLWMAYQLRFDFFGNRQSSEYQYLHQIWKLYPVIIPLKLFVLLLFRQYSGLLSYFSAPDLFRLTGAMTVSSALIALSRGFLDTGLDWTPPRGVILIDYVLSIGFLASLRFGFRVLRERHISRGKGGKRTRAKKIGVIGVGDTGANLIKELFLKRGLGMLPVAGFDDDKSKWGTRVHGIPILGGPEKLLDMKLDLGLEEVILAMPGASAKRVGEVVNMLNELHLPFATVPSIDQLASGQVRVSQIRPVDIEDLLKRPTIRLEKETISDYLGGKVCLVTGAGGSIGSELCRQILSYHPRRLILLEQSEVQMFQIEQELEDKGSGGLITPIIADILDEKRILTIFEKFKPEIVFHAAAHKHVPLMERQPSEAIKNNSMGSARLAEMALQSGVERFVLISTDKAINPTNVMGASKRLAEIYLQSLAHQKRGATKFMAVRFGNVLGSSGSVIPTFRKQIAAGGPVKVTHPEVTRYFMTIPEACGLVLQAGAIGEGGEIFVLDMGEPVRIVELARQLIELSGLKPDEDIEIEYVGLRPGEKLFEELQHHGENIQETQHPKIMKFLCEPLPMEKVQEIFAMFDGNINELEPNELKARLNKAVPEYKPYLN